MGLVTTLWPLRHTLALSNRGSSLAQLLTSQLASPFSAMQLLSFAQDVMCFLIILSRSPDCKAVAILVSKSCHKKDTYQMIIRIQHAVVWLRSVRKGLYVVKVGQSMLSIQAADSGALGAGAAVPEGADAVVQIENTQQLPDSNNGEKRIAIKKVSF